MFVSMVLIILGHSDNEIEEGSKSNFCYYEKKVFIFEIKLIIRHFTN